MGRNRARFVAAHLLAWVGWGVAVGVAWQAPVSPTHLALATTGVALVAALALAIPAARIAHLAPMAVAIGLALALEVVIVSIVLVTGDEALLPLTALGVAACGLELTGVRAVGTSHPLPAVRVAPTTLAFALGLAMAAAATAAAPVAPAVVAAVIHAVALVLAVAARVTVDERNPTPVERTTSVFRAWPLALGAAGITAIVAIRPVLSGIGMEAPNGAAPAALTLAIGAVLGPPLAMLTRRLRPALRMPALCTVAGIAALSAPLARPGAADFVVAVVLGVAAAAIVALIVLARRDRAEGGPLRVVLALAGALGAGMAALLLASVPATDVVLGAAIAMVVAAIGTWAPTARAQGVTKAASAPPTTNTRR